MSRKPTDVPPLPPSLRPLLPAQPQSRGPELPQRHFEFKRKRQAAACEPCREHKTKCDGNRPSCSACLRRGSECKFEAEPKETHFQALKRKFDSVQGEASSLQQVYDLLRTRPEDEAQSIFRRIRDGESPESILQFVQHGDLLVQLSLTAGTSPRTGKFPSTSDAASSNPSEQHSPHLSRATSSTAPSQEQSRQDTSATPDGTETLRTETPSDYFRPCEIAEPLLDQVRPSRWTTVSDDDGLMRGLLNRFFQLQYRWGSIFHKDHFLQDMIAGESIHCSPLLVNAVLACALHANRTAITHHRYWEPGGNPDSEFLAEAKKLWAAELNSDKASLTTVQAGLLLSMLYGVDSHDRNGWRCVVQSIEMAASLGLFDPQVQTEDDSKVEHARAYTAWSAFCWQSFWCHHFFAPPLIKRPPAYPLPDPHKHPDWYGEVHIKFSHNDRITPTGHGDLFRAKAEFSTTLNTIADRIFPP